MTLLIWIFLGIFILLVLTPLSYFTGLKDLIVKLFKRICFIRENGIHNLQSTLHLLDQVNRNLKKGAKLNLNISNSSSSHLDLLVSLVHFNRNYGICIRDGLFSLKEYINEEINFQRSKDSILSSAYAQFIGISLMSYGFSFLAIKTAKLGISPLIIIICLTLQSLGTFIFSFIYKKNLHKTFKDLNILIPMLMKTKCLSTLGLASSLVIRKLELKKLDLISKKDEKYICDSFKLMITDWRESGVNIEHEAELLRRELIFLRTNAIKSYLKQTELLKFIITVLFFMSSYFIAQIPLFSGIF